MAISCSFHSLVLFLLTFVIFLGLCFRRNRQHNNLPPGPPAWPVVGNLLHLKFSGDTFEDFVNKLHRRYGPIFTIWMGSRPLIMITGREIAHEALIQKGPVFANRPSAGWAYKLFSSNQHSINMAAYGTLWRSLRRNLVTVTLAPSAIKAFEEARQLGIGRLLKNLRNEAARNGGLVSVADHFRSAVFSIVLHMCFGSLLDEATVRNLQGMLRQLVRTAGRVEEVHLPIPSFFLRQRQARMVEIRRRQREALLPLIHKRRDAAVPPSAGCAYVDSLLTVTVENGRSLDDDELVTLCTEFINAGSATTWTALQWVMAILVIRQDVQARLYDEIVVIAGREPKPLGENDLQQMPYLDAVVKETLRRHPPTHFVLPHAVTRPCKLAGYDVPADASVNFYVAGMAMDSRAWQDPSEFKPERFADNGVEVDLTGAKDIKMMPFGAGRRQCPGLRLALLHIHLFVARLVQEFAWHCKPGETVDLSETKKDFSKAMKYPLQAVIKQRDCAQQ